MKFLTTVLFVSVLLVSSAQTSITPLDCVAPFYHGVASGEPLTDAVIIWTRVTPENFNMPLPVEYKMATDSLMQNVVASGSVLTNANKDFTVKVDVTGLTPDTYYYYEFTALEANSPRGRTKTAPEEGVDSLRFAVVSCANLEAGYFNVYEAITQRNDIEAVLMLGDYIYEYEEGGYSPNGSVDRVFDPTDEIVELADYRLRYSVYHMDRSLQKCHQNYPWICVWDDHESANDSYENGAENHNSGEGFWSDRKLAAQQAYFEWLPIREKAPGNFEIFRKFEYGGLMDLIMVDTRLHGRQEQGVNENDPNRTMLGQDQYNWLTNQLSSSNAQWKVLGNQVIFAPINIFGSPLNGDAWDGYPAERQRVLDHITTNSIENFVVLTGDVHTSWGLDIKNGSTNVGVEYVTPSVTSPGVPVNVGGILQIENPHIKYVELTKHGYILLDVNSQRIQGDWFYVNTIDVFNDASETWGTSYYASSGSMQLTQTSTVALPGSRYNVELAPLCPRIYENSASLDALEPAIVGIYPNPAADYLAIQYAPLNSSEHTLTLYSSEGKEVLKKVYSPNYGTAGIITISVSQLPAGNYFLQLKDSLGNVIRREFIKH